MSAVAVTDHGNMFGAFAFYHEAVKNGVRPILGVEAYIAPADRRDRESQAASESGDGYAYHLTILAATQTGYRNLVRLVSEAYLTGFYHRPRMDKALLRQYSEGLIGLSGCLKGEVAGALVRGNFARRRRRPSSNTRRSSARGTSSSRSWTTACRSRPRSSRTCCGSRRRRERPRSRPTTATT